MQKEKKRYLVLLLLLLPLCYLFPYTGDDWAWGSSIGIERLNTWFDNYSGRYFGNLMVLVLTRSTILKTISMALCLTTCIYLINALTESGKTGFWLILTGFAFIPATLLRQSVVWTAGFANYTTSITFTLAYIYLVRNIFQDEEPSYPKWAALPVFLFGACNAMIVEHMTIYNVLLAAYVIGYCWVKFKKVFLVQVMYFVGCVAGTIYMFSNSVYHSVAIGVDGYREIGSDAGLIYKMKENYLTVICPDGFMKNTVLLLLMLLMCMLLYKQYKGQFKSRIPLGFMTVYTAYACVNIQNQMERTRRLLWLDAGMTTLYIIAVFFFFVLLPVGKAKKEKILFLYGSIGFTIAPLLAVSPVSSRCLFAAYVLFLYLIVELYGALSQSIQERIEKCIRYMKIAVITAFTFLMLIYGSITRADKARIAKAQRQSNNGKTTIKVKRLPYKAYLWCCEPTTGSVWEERFILYYGLNKEISIKNVD